MKIVTVIGARPQFIKAAPVSRAILKHNNKIGDENQINEVIVHTGQHYDQNMSEVFFDELNIPKPDYNLGIGSGSHGKQTGEMLYQIEEVLFNEKPDWVLVYGDTNTTLAGALAASKLHIPVAHIEAGLRSYNRDMPEEINRLLADKVSSVLFCPTEQAVNNLIFEGVNNVFNDLTGVDFNTIYDEVKFPVVFNVGDVMFDALRYNVQLTEEKSNICNYLDITPGEYYVATIHRAENVDNKDNLRGIIEKLSMLDREVILPIHPRTRKQINEFGISNYLSNQNNIKIIEPLGYLDMIQLLKGAKVAFTDSGGLQKEAFLLRVPCITLRYETEWTETVDSGWNILVGLGAREFTKSIIEDWELNDVENPYGDGYASEYIVEILSKLNHLLHGENKNE